jgi:YggT family protein
MIILVYAISLYQFILLARVLLSWFPNIDRYNPIVRFLYDVTEPVLRPIRNALAGILPQGFPIDLSPLIVLLLLNVVSRLLL